jgi:hypothetical protein
MPMLPGLFGLHVDAGYYSAAAHQWVREPAAEFTCRHGCTRYAVGAADVAQFTRAITAWHIAHCPARKEKPDDDHS